MKYLRIKSTIRGSGFSLDPEQIVSVPGQISAEFASGLVEAGAAEWTTKSPDVEQATEPAAEERETADVRPKRRTKEDVLAQKRAEEWDMKVSPGEYLKRWPDGPKAEKAKKLIGE